MFRNLTVRCSRRAGLILQMPQFEIRPMLRLHHTREVFRQPNIRLLAMPLRRPSVL